MKFPAAVCVLMLSISGCSSESRSAEPDGSSMSSDAPDSESTSPISESGSEQSSPEPDAEPATSASEPEPSSLADSEEAVSESEVTESSDPNRVMVAEPLIIEVFAASDVDEPVSVAIAESLDLAADLWGLYWPVEYWVMGVDPAAGQALVEDFCARRDARGQWDYDECMRREAGSEPHSLIEYQQIGAQAIAEDRPYGTAGRNGSAEWGIHRFATTLPFGLAGYFGLPGAEDVKTVLHEYWHAVQHSFIDTTDFDERDALMGPVWFVEGSAEFMAQYGTAQLVERDLMPAVPEGEWPFTYEEQMTRKLRLIDQALVGECQDRTLSSIIGYSDPCSWLGYELGAWAIAHLLTETHTDVLLDEFHPMVATVGWEEAFETVFGRTVEELDEEISQFLQLSDREKLAILPQP